MAEAAGAGGAGAAAAAAIANAIKASGAIVRVSPDDFQAILDRQPEAPLVVEAQGGFFKTNYQYMTVYKGFVFFAKSPDQLPLPEDCEIVAAEKIWTPQ
ncbi:MAG: hypothetical protein GWP08_10240 [Nitrospiraceae bacterium]|nr:hypothetical protein [Nitrospiraceae bacterium]